MNYPNFAPERLENLKDCYISRLYFMVSVIEDVTFDGYNLDLLREEVNRLKVYNDIFVRILEDIDEKNS